MIRILHDTSYDFIRWWKWAVGLTAAFIALGLGSLALQGINYSIEFTGGTMMQVEFSKPVDVAALRAALDNAAIHGAEIQQFGTNREFTIRAQEAEQAGAKTTGAETVAGRIRNVLTTRYGSDQIRVVRTEAVGPRVGSELRRDAVIAMFLSFLVTTVYLAIRFEWRFGVAALIATGHDVFTTLAFLKLLHLEVSLTVVAAILTVIGYSLNDTIIIFDRVREDLRKGRKETLYQTLNRAINETLPRSILTHATTLAATLALLFFAGEVIRPFAWVMAFGIFTGTFSSIYIASPVLLWIERKWPRKTATSKGTLTATRTSPTRRSTATAAT
ncbi:MAG: protein translocase subunit SecF [Gemmatimonadaceae bacterium]|nr:protein translocase subunit SecF [Gemmatimonadaceae bacterium]